MKFFRSICCLSFCCLFAISAMGQERTTRERPQPVKKAPQQVRKVEPRKDSRDKVVPADRESVRSTRDRRTVNRDGRVETGTVRPVERRKAPKR